MLYPWMLLGFLGLSVPVIIHLIQRQRLKPQMLATLRFLDREDLANAFAPVPRDKLQLLLRLLLLGLFVLLMSRLVVGDREPGPRTMAVILDQSMSMRQLTASNQPLFETCRLQVLELIESLRPDDRLSFTLVGDEVTTSTGFLHDKVELRELVQQVAVSDTGGDALVPTITRTLAQLRSRRAVNSCVIVFSDHQKLNYADYLDADQDGKTNANQKSSPLATSVQARVFLIDEPSKEGANLSLVRGSFSPSRAFVGTSSRVTAEVRNDSQEQQIAAVIVKDGDVTGEQRSVTLAAGEVVRLDLVQRFESPLDTVSRLELPEDVLPGDNQFFVPMRMRERRQVLLVTPSEGDDDSQELSVRFRGLDLLTYALNPGEALGTGSGTNVTIKRVTPQSLGRVSLPLYSLIVVYGVADLPEQSRKDLKAFLSGGGGIWLIPEGDVSPARFNETFGEVLGGALLGQLATPESPTSMDKSEATVGTPILHSLLREEWGPTTDLFFHRYMRLEAPGTSIVALRASNGDPLATLAKSDRGFVVLQLFPCDLESSSLPRSSSFVPYVQQLVSVLGERHRNESLDALRVGEVLRMKVPEFRNLQGEVKLDGPESKSFPLSGPERDEVRIAGLHLAGDYRATHTARPNGRERRLAVNAVDGEASLERLSDEDATKLFGNEVSPRIPFEKLSDQFIRRKEITPLLALLVLLALITESLVGAWQSRRGARHSGGPASSATGKTGSRELATPQGGADLPSQGDAA